MEGKQAEIKNNPIKKNTKAFIFIWKFVTFKLDSILNFSLILLRTKPIAGDTI